MLFQHIAKGPVQCPIVRFRGAAAGGDDVKALFEAGHFLAERSAQTALDQIARDRVAYLLADGETDELPSRRQIYDGELTGADAPAFSVNMLKLTVFSEPMLFLHTDLRTMK